MFSFKGIRYLALIMTLVIMLGGQLLAQGSTGEITGVVTDSSKFIIPGVDVHLQNPATGLSRHSITNDTGVFYFPVLPPGNYTISIEMEGFQRQYLEVQLQVQQTIRQDFALQVGTITETVEVRGTSVQLNTSDATVGQVIGNKQIIELPLNSRNYLHLTQLSPGVTLNASVGGAPGFQGGHRSRQAITVSGQRNTFNHYTLDGIENTDPNFNTYILLPSIDALEEFKVQRATYPAEFGFSVSQINVTTKSGTNDFHGSLFEFLRNEKLDAKNYFDDKERPIPPFKRNQFGGTLGGPILRDKLFFFGNYEGLRETKTLTAISTSPTSAMRMGDLSGLRPIYDPATRAYESGVLVAQMFPNNQIPQDRIDPIAIAAMKYWPLPNLPGTVLNYANSDPRRTDTDQYMGRLDFNMTDDDNFHGRFNYAKDSEYSPSSFPDQGTHTKTRADQVMGSYTRVFSPTIVNEFRFGWTRFDNKVIGTNSYENDINGQELGIGGINLDNDPAFWGIPVFGVSGFTGFGDRNHIYLTHNNTYEFHENLSWSKSNHFFKMGLTMSPIQYNQLGNQFAVGNITFNGSITSLPNDPGKTGEGLGDFLLGLPYQPTVPVKAADAQLRSVYMAGYFTDSWKISPKLTLDYGIRYEYLPPFKDINDQAVNVWDIFGENPILVRASNKGENLDPYQDQMVRFTRAELVRDGRMGEGLVMPDRNNWAPRLGMAYHVRENTVIRAGAGVFYNMIDMGNSIYDMARTLGGLRREYTNADFPDLTLKSPFRTGVEESVVPISQPLILANAYDSRTSYITQWTVDLQQSLTRDLVVDIAYVGSQGHKLKKFLPMNVPGPGPGSIDPRRPHQQFGYIQYPNTVGNSNYNSLQIKVQQNMRNGISALGAYTYSKSIDDGSAVRVGSGENFMANDHNNTGKGERARSGFDVRQRFVGSLLWEMPFLRESGDLTSMILGGWQLGSIISLESGMPMSPASPTSISNAGGFSGYRPNVVEGANPNLPPGDRTVDRWFNTEAFELPALYTYGNAGRNIIDGPGVISIDMSLMKRVKFTETKHLEFRAEIFNLPNHPIFDFPNASLTSRTYGRISSTKLDSRQIQLGLKLIF